MHFREFVDSVQSIIAVAELVKNDSKDGNATMADFLYALSNAGISMDYDKFKSVYDSNPQLKNVIQQFDAETVTFVGGEPQVDAPAGDIPPEEKVGQMAKRAMNKRESVESTLHEDDEQALMRQLMRKDGIDPDKVSDGGIFDKYRAMARKQLGLDESKLPPHLAKMFDKYGNFKDPKKQAKFDAMQKKEREKKQMKWVDVTPKGYGPVEEDPSLGPRIVGALERIVDKKSADEIKFFDGKAKVDMYTASAFMQVYNKANDANKKKMAKMIETRPGFISLMKKVFNMISGVKEGFKIRDKSRGYGVSDKTYATRAEAEKARLLKMAQTGGDWEVIKEAEERNYICVHAKKGKYECSASSSYGAAKKAAEHWGLKSTAGIDAHLADEKKTATERALTKAEKSKLKHYEKKLPDADFKERYGSRWKEVKYATATKMAKKNA